MLFPGSITWDAGNGIMYSLGLDRSNRNNPWFQNYLFGQFYRLGGLLNRREAGVAIYCTLQFAIEIFLLGGILSQQSWTLDRPKLKFLVFFYGLLPFFPIFALVMGKDSNFALAVLFHTGLSLQAVQTPDAFWGKRRNRVALIGSIVMMGLFRNHAGLFPALCLLIYAFAGVKTAIAKRTAIVTLCAVLFCSSWLPELLKIEKADTREIMSIPLQTTAYYMQHFPDQVTEEERAAVSAVIDFDRMVWDYDPMIADPIKDASTFTPETSKAFMRMWLNLCLKHPRTVLRGWWYSVNSYLSPLAINDAKPHATVGFSIDPDEAEILGLHNSNPMQRLVRGMDKLSLRIPVLNLFVKIGLYFWVTVADLAVVIIKRQRRYLYCFAPLIMIWIGCMFSPVNGYFRYAYSAILSIPVLTATVVYIPDLRNHR